MFHHELYVHLTKSVSPTYTALDKARQTSNSLKTTDMGHCSLSSYIGLHCTAGRIEDTVPDFNLYRKVSVYQSSAQGKTKCSGMTEPCH